MGKKVNKDAVKAISSIKAEFPVIREFDLFNEDGDFIDSFDTEDEVQKFFEGQEVEGHDFILKKDSEKIYIFRCIPYAVMKKNVEVTKV